MVQCFLKDCFCSERLAIRMSCCALVMTDPVRFPGSFKCGRPGAIAMFGTLFGPVAVGTQSNERSTIVLPANHSTVWLGPRLDTPIFFSFPLILLASKTAQTIINTIKILLGKRVAVLFAACR